MGKSNVHRAGLAVSWMILWGWFCVFLCFGQKASLRLMWIDMRTGFRYVHGRTSIVVLLLLGLFLLEGAAGVFWYAARKGLLTISWNIRIRRKCFEIHTGDFKHACFMALAASSIFILFLSLLWRDISSRRSGDKLESVSVAHALGGIDDKPSTNSRDALLYNYDLGHRVFEVDFSITSDHKIVCLHDWGHGAMIQGRGGEGDILSKEDFESGIIYEKYAPISLEEILLFMSEHEDVWLVTDSKESAEDLVKLEFSYLVEEARANGVEQVLNRIAVQIYNPEMYETVKGIYEFPSVIFTLYQYGWKGNPETFADICRFCVRENIDIITMWYYLATPEILGIAKQFGIDVYVHTLDDIEKAAELKKLGVKGFYTDFLTPEMLENDSYS